MAVAFSTGGSGQMRSDFMISDAALPIRIEQEQADQSGRFSQVLSGIGGEARKQDIPAEKLEVMEKFTGNDGKVDLHSLAKAVADGEVELQDIPEELLTGEMLQELIKLVKLPEEDKNPEDGNDPAVQEMMAELTAMFSAQQTVTPDDKSAEISELTRQEPVQEIQAVQPKQETEQIAEVMQPVQEETVQPEQVQAPEQPVQEVPQEVQAESQDIQTVQTEVQVVSEEGAEAVQPEMVSVQPKQELSAERPEQTAQEIPAEAAAAILDEIDGRQAQNSGQESQSFSQPESTSAPVRQTPAEQEPQADFTSTIPEIRHVETKASEKQPEEQPQQEEAPVFTEHTVQRSRVVSKSDELQMIKGAADSGKADESAVQTAAQPQTAQPERPVVFTREDGGEVTVKPSEVAQQVADKLVERTKDLPQGETEYSVTLEPEDLGRITVRMTKTADGAVSVSIAAENSKTLRIIEENGAHIQESLRQNGVQLEDWQTVSESRQDAQAQDYQGSSKNPYRESDNRRQEDDSDEKSFAELIASM